jgi:hypothetical protein
MASYAMAHIKLEMLLQESGATFLLSFATFFTATITFPLYFCLEILI